MPNLKNKKVIKDQQGQRKYPGRVTKIQGNTMATTGYGDISLYVVPNVGNPMVVPANSGNRVFPGASSFTEYPIANNSGWLEKYQVGGKKLDTSNWEQSSLDSLNAYNKGQRLIIETIGNNPDTLREAKKRIVNLPLNIRKNFPKVNNTQVNSMLIGPDIVFMNKKPVGVQKKEKETVEKERTDIYTDKALFNKAYKSEMDSINVRKPFNQTFEPGNKTRSLTKEEKEYWKDKKTGLYPNIVEYNPAYPGSGYFGHFKKPVVHNVYQEPELEPVKTQAVNKPSPINKNRTEVNFGQKYKTYVYKGEKNPRYKDPTTGKDLDPDISKSVDAKGNYNPVYLEQKEYGGLLDTYQDGGKTLEQKINKALGDPRKKASDAAINKKWFNKETKKWEVEDDIDNFRHPMAARYTAEAIANKFPDWMKYSGMPQVAGFVGSTALGVGHELANNKYTSNNPKDYPNYTFWDTVSEAGEDAFNNMVGAGVGVLPISDDKKTAYLRYLSDNNKIPDGYANKKTNMYFKSNGGLLEKYGDGGKINGDDEHKKFLTNWYSNRKIQDPYIQEAFDLDKDSYIKNTKEYPNYTYVDSIRNDPHVTGNYDKDTNKILLTKDSPDYVKTHELNHFLNIKDHSGDYMRTIHKDIVKNELKPKSEASGVYKDKYDYFSEPDEVHSRIMVLREKAGFKPNENVTEEQLNSFLKTYKGDVDNINDIFELSKDRTSVLNMLNYMATNNNQNKNLRVAKYGGWLEQYAGGGETDPPVNLRSASTQLASPVSTQAPEVPLNKTGWDWVKQKYENRQPSDWNMLMMDKSGSYVDSGVDPFSLMLTAPQQVVKLANLPFKQLAKNSVESFKNNVESIKNNVGKIKQNFKNASSNTKSVITESVGELIQGKSNRKAIKEGNEWLHNWIKDPATQSKIDGDLDIALESHKAFPFKELKDEGWAIENEDNLSKIFFKDMELIRGQSKNFKPNSQEYGLSKQFKENLNQYLGKDEYNWYSDNIHKGNLGVSYKHGYSPEGRDFIEKGVWSEPERYGSWITRSPFYSQKNRASTTVHEGAHDWVSADAFKKSGMESTAFSVMSPETKKNYLKWQELRLSGENPSEKMGSLEAYQAYLSDPTEMHARIIELRKDFKLVPGQEVTSGFAKKIIDKINKNKTKVDPRFLNVVDNDPKKLSELFNRFWSAAPIVGVGYLGGKALQQNKQDNGQWLNKYQDGGYVVNSGDNLSTIAKNNNTDIATLQSLNNIKDVNRISIGQNLILPKKQVGTSNTNVQAEQIKDLNSYSFSEAFKIARKQYGPNKIFEHNGKKFGTNLAGEKFVPDQEELAKNNMLNDAVVNHLNDQNKKVESIYTTKNTVKLQPTWKENTEIDAQNQEFNKLKNAELINKYQSLASPNEKYIIVDKKKGKMHVYLGGKEIESYNVGTGENKGDEQTRTWVDKKTHKTDWSKGNKQTGAGIYTISFIDEHNKHYGNAPSFHLKNESGTEVPTAIHAGFGDRLRRIANNDVKNNDPKSGEDTRFSNGCVNGLCKDMTDLYKNDLKQDRDKNTGTKVFILPDDDSNYFSVKNNKLNFTTSGKYNQTTAYSPKNLNASPIKIKVLNKDFETKEVKNMAKTLEDNKSQIMKDANIDNDTYNKLSKMAISLSLQETKGGTDYNIRIKGYGIPGTNKEEQQGLVSGLKNAEALLNKYKKDPMSSIKDFAKLYLYANGQSSTPPKITEKTSVNSKGMTQIKYDAQNKELVSQFKKYGITKDNLNQGKNAAIATVLMLSYMHNNELPSLKEKIKKMNISDEEALLYLNQGKKSEIVNGTATPKKNMYIKNIKKYSDQISLKQQSY